MARRDHPDGATRVKPGDRVIAVVAYNALRKAEATAGRRGAALREPESCPMPARDGIFPGAWSPPQLRPVLHLVGPDAACALGG